MIKNYLVEGLWLISFGLEKKNDKEANNQTTEKGKNTQKGETKKHRETRN